jgi:hypothetical protein
MPKNTTLRRIGVMPAGSKNPPNRITFALDLFSGPAERDLSRKSLNILLKALFDLNVAYLEAHPEAPLLYQANVHYMEEPPGQEDWQDIPTTIKIGYGDCEDLASWRAAELNVKYGVKAKTFFKEMKRPDGSYLYHILVMHPPSAQHPQGMVEDPSRILGMR